MKLAFTTGALVLAATLLTYGVFATADEVVYRWKDEAGNQVNSDRPPPLGIDYETISTSSSMVHTVDPEVGTAPPKANPSAGSTGKDAPPVAAKTPVAEKNPEYCARAKDNLFQLDSHARIRLRNDQGELRYLSQEEKAAELQKAKDSIKAFCE